MRTLFLFAAIFIPTVAFAAAPTNLTQLIYQITNLTLAVIPIIVSIALVFFFWNIAQLILNAGDAKERQKAIPRLIWGIIVLAVIVSIGGLIAVLQNTFFLQGGSSGTSNTNQGTNSFNNFWGNGPDPWDDPRGGNPPASF